MTFADPSLVTYLLPTYARVRWLNDALWCALNQSIPVNVLIYNDCPEQVLVFDHPRVMIVNERFTEPTLGEKRNAMLHMADGAGVEIVSFLDDDDWILPDYTSRMLGMLTADYCAGHAQRCLIATGGDDGERVHWDIGHGYALRTIVRIDAAIACGGFATDRDNTEDSVFFHRLDKYCAMVKPEGVFGYCCRWANGVHHVSGISDLLSGPGFRQNAADRISQGYEPRGMIPLTPKLRHDYFKDLPLTYLS